MSKVRRGILISFEGTEGSGKSTLIQRVSSLLNQKGHKTLVTREPGGSPLAEKLRPLILELQMAPRTELFLYEAARAEHVSQVIEPALRAGKIVLCDRFTDSTLAYQGTARGIPWREIQTLNQMATAGLQPDWVVFLDLPPAVGLARVRDPNRFEAEGLRFHEKVRKGYLKARAQRPGRWLTLRSDRSSVEELAEEVIAKLRSRRKI